jgi:hypothetical protein
MYYTRHFAHPETLARARNWLIRLGFHPQRVHASSRGVPRLAVSADPGRLAVARLLINAVERSDPDGRPSFWDVARLARCAGEADADGSRPDAEAEAGPDRARRPHTVVIGWHPHDFTHDGGAGTDVEAVCEVMARWD